METMRVTPSPCPYCKIVLDTVCRGAVPPKENDISICVNCGEMVIFGPYLTLKKCDLTPDQLADKLGLLIYGTMLQTQEYIKNR